MKGGLWQVLKSRLNLPVQIRDRLCEIDCEIMNIIFHNEVVNIKYVCRDGQNM